MAVPTLPYPGVGAFAPAAIQWYFKQKMAFLDTPEPVPYPA